MSRIDVSDSPRAAAAAWPRRRWPALAVVVPVLGAVMLSVSNPGRLGAGPVWWVLFGVVVLAGAATLVSYVPATGARPEVGCTPCAGMSALTVVAAAMLLRDAGPDLTGVALAAAVSIFGLGQRHSQPRTCPTSSDPEP